jgi:hypothetical protein
MLAASRYEPINVRSADTTLIYDIATLLNAVYQLTIEPTQEDRLPKRLTKKLYPLCHYPLCHYPLCQ